VDFGTKLVNGATTELVPPLGAALRKLGRTFDVIAGIQHAQVRGSPPFIYIYLSAGFAPDDETDFAQVVFVFVFFVERE
jgi:hypothetical protein